MPYRKTANALYKKGKKYVKKRYTKKSGAVKYRKLAADVYRIQRSLNVEHKHIDYTFGSGPGAAIAAQRPTKNSPIIIALNTPVKGTAYDNRIGNQLRIVHMTTKYQFTYHNNTDLMQRQSVRARIVFAKNADDVPVIANLLQADANGHYTDLSFVNTQEYKKFVWLKSLDIRSSYTQPTNRYPPSAANALTASPGAGDTNNIDVTATSSQVLNIANFYKRKSTKCSIKMMFQNNSDTVEQMKPYLVLTSDVVENPGDDYDYITVTGQIRMTYVDN